MKAIQCTRLFKSCTLKKYTLQRGNYWRKSGVERLIHRRDYVGTAFYNKGTAIVPKRPQQIGGYKKNKKTSRKLKSRDEWIAIPVPAIIDEELFERAQKRLKENLLYNKRNKQYQYFLSGKVFCGCGARRVGDGVNGHHYYRCAARIYKFPVPTKCTFEGVNAEVLDEMVWTRLLNLLSTPEVIKAQVIRWQKKQDKVKFVSHDEVSQAKRALEVLVEEEDSYTKAFGAKLISFEKYKQLMNTVKAKKEAIESQTKESLLSVQEDNIDLDHIDDVCRDILLDLRTITTEKKQEYMRSMVKSIYVKERSEALVNGYIPLYTQAQNIQDESKRRNRRAS